MYNLKRHRWLVYKYFCISSESLKDEAEIVSEGYKSISNRDVSEKMEPRIKIW